MKRIVLGLVITGLSLVAADFSQMSLDELNSLRGSVAVEDRDAFRSEMQSRLEVMTPEDRAAFREARISSANVGLRTGLGNNQATRASTGITDTLGDNLRLRDGSGVGNINTQQRLNSQTSTSIRQNLRDGSGAGSLGQNAR